MGLLRDDAFIEEALAQKKKIMGIGHRVYKVLDPRAPHLRKMAIKLTDELGETSIDRDSDDTSVRTEVLDLVQRQPEDIATLLRGWLAEG